MRRFLTYWYLFLATLFLGLVLFRLGVLHVSGAVAQGMTLVFCIGFGLTLADKVERAEKRERKPRCQTKTDHVFKLESDHGAIDTFKCERCGGRIDTRVDRTNASAVAFYDEPTYEENTEQEIH